MKNKFIINDFGVGETKKGELFYFDVEDYEKINKHVWHIDDSGYVRSRINGKLIRMHRLITDCPDSMIVDHKNGSKSRNDNRKNNLRICTRSDNNKNVNTRGIHFEKHANKWRTRIMVDNKKIHLGYFSNERDALDARISAELKYYREFAQIR